MRVHDVMSRPVVTVYTDTPVRVAAVTLAVVTRCGSMLRPDETITAGAQARLDDYTGLRRWRATARGGTVTITGSPTAKQAVANLL